MWEIVFEGKVSSQLAQNKKLAVLKRSEQYLNQNDFLQGFTRRKKRIFNKLLNVFPLKNYIRLQQNKSQKQFPY
jgi:hypothetical protein